MKNLLYLLFLFLLSASCEDDGPKPEARNCYECTTTKVSYPKASPANSTQIKSDTTICNATDREVWIFETVNTIEGEYKVVDGVEIITNSVTKCPIME